ncbi:hypothetical protein EYF80_040893 [Liparis tanakae]|uniref:Uncharacterized protein n=1 Tax=Liparis tanakae TaxID=230148 RepID=A0A4Z2G6N1_9TELE|nr:hypothetical protein EYF80_040893 [Liparis tanakae]
MDPYEANALTVVTRAPVPGIWCQAYWFIGTFKWNKGTINVMDHGCFCYYKSKGLLGKKKKEKKKNGTIPYEDTKRSNGSKCGYMKT